MQSRKHWPLLAATSTLYAAFGMIFGVMQGGLPPLMRARGVDLAGVGWSFIMLVPFGLTFLWAPLIDRIRLNQTTPRIAWIATMQAVVVALLLIVAQGEHLAPRLLLGLGLGIAFAAATMDMALDALATIAIPPEARTTAGGLKVAALALGALAGGGLFVAGAGALGWATTFTLCAAASALALLPLFCNLGWERDAAASAPTPAPRPLLQRDTARRMLLLTMATCCVVPLVFLNRIMLVDLGVPLARIGWIVGTAAPVFGLAASLTAIPLLRKLGARQGMLGFAGLAVLAALTLLTGAAYHHVPLAILGAILISGGASGFYVIVCALTLGWAQGSRPATDYAMLYGVSRLAATLLMIALTRLIAIIGWPSFYAGATVALVIACLTFRKALGTSPVAMKQNSDRLR